MSWVKTKCPVSPSTDLESLKMREPRLGGYQRPDYLIGKATTLQLAVCMNHKPILRNVGRVGLLARVLWSDNTVAFPIVRLTYLGE